MKAESTVGAPTCFRTKVTLTAAVVDGGGLAAVLAEFCVSAKLVGGDLRLFSSQPRLATAVRQPSSRYNL
jgi:hypothetical protein